MYLIPIGAIVCIGLLLSTITRNSAAAVVGTLMISLLIQLLGILPGLGGIQPYLLSTQFNAWQGLLRDADRLGADHPRRLGLRAVRRAGAVRCAAGVPAPRRRRRLTHPGRTDRGRWGRVVQTAAAPLISASSRSAGTGRDSK